MSLSNAASSTLGKLKGLFGRSDADAASTADLPVRLSSRSYTGAPNTAVRELGFDQPLMWVTVALLCWGLVMVYSASIALPDNPRFANYAPTHFVLRHGVAITVGIVASMLAFQFPMRTWETLSPWLFAGALVLLVLVLVPVIGKGVNGARRWFSLGVMNFQPSELTKLAVLLYAAGYMVRKMEVKERFFRAVAPVAVALGVVGLLLLAEPDFGAFMVIAVIALGILFLGGVNVRMFILIGTVMVAALATMVLTSPWRLQRLMAFTDPWSEEHALGKGYQLSHSLIAFGRGEIFGVGLGGSVEKLHWLPEAHTDFLLAVVGEEFGLIGVLLVIGLFLWLTRRIMYIGRQAIALDQVFSGLVAQGVGLWFGFQAFINIGVNLGALPTKGLTLPFMSYGGSAILMNMVALAIVLRVDYENRQLMRGGRA
ncbi:putative lipid II flippase FtsW [Hydrogenophaga sp. 5NK40-0174]|uniref:putative lipid II flippase FtsW n=1 Tax=Hydrogenophaga sp. 5NK40-0174 TaxID=3127649 RepID=UPI00310AF334